MTDYSYLSKIVLPLLEPFQQHSFLIAGELANSMCDGITQSSHQLTGPFSLAQLTDLSAFEVAVVSDLTETLTKTEAESWLGLLKNRHSPHIILVVDRNIAEQKAWQFADFLSLGFKLIKQIDNWQIFHYAIESYQPKKDWLNSRYWANPENFEKYRW